MIDKDNSENKVFELCAYSFFAGMACCLILVVLFMKHGPRVVL